MSNYIKYLLMLLIVAGAAYGAQYLILSSMEVNQLWAQSEYTLEGLYAFGAIASLVILLSIFGTQYAMPEKLGLIFLALMTLKGVASYIYIKNGLNKFENDFIEYNFLVVFFVFLFFDVYIAFSALNQEDTKR
ncbi:hypothetical protein [Sphingobacterium rhinopitheci]|uniref:hypothetical protein n=1 Tax=Sphingobacterium rhinopitheci TaxID=2781960 RepID=UPI001F520D29|nr:hypothetical protein [Sphingobacterium rhinopitheci]MCI0921183.1 hypothetical protein [Sphingobacterium rhinopitheci]